MGGSKEGMYVGEKGLKSFTIVHYQYRRRSSISITTQAASSTDKPWISFVPDDNGAWYLYLSFFSSTNAPSIPATHLTNLCTTPGKTNIHSTKPAYTGRLISPPIPASMRATICVASSTGETTGPRTCAYQGSRSVGKSAVERWPGVMRRVRMLVARSSAVREAWRARRPALEVV